eukprot:gnl/TRDRNA2_/TRDRNA2_185950_c0_seq1.p1 gnl/TRDRNA2_/TRDRNA2_185950_c0~~gnl/TRDRNA2_/TRDRNA2_185950_c0_seq1.p1  ORF type:complete len:146 (+),score=39.32 gnl/TRDRNA2_/TRDRNA2_185950_c0_seq1:116-553(+)
MAMVVRNPHTPSGYLEDNYSSLEKGRWESAEKAAKETGGRVAMGGRVMVPEKKKKSSQIKKADDVTEIPAIAQTILATPGNPLKKAVTVPGMPGPVSPLSLEAQLPYLQMAMQENSTFSAVERLKAENERCKRPDGIDPTKNAGI